MTPKIGKRMVRCLLGGVLCALMCAPFAKAQLGTGTIVGTVTDQTGAAVPGAKVTATNLETNVQQTANTDAAGQYVIPSLKIGTYSITVESPGFQSFIQTGIIVDVQARVEVDVKLALGAVTQQIEVTAAPPLLITQNADIGQVVGSKEVMDLPLNGREYDKLVYLSPGVTLAAPGMTVGGGDGYFDANGNSSLQNNFVLV